ncbi:MAG TPA: GDSL-type esterase/lipase family protein [Deltaproteobacteria bacterium]|nr:GDSL-type esterase/lipase family protein [Deltaproteobacteria bacterium]HNU74629.1 GDSL-type esterase/lipase family protein [Deltaproteobacteria bacterium]HRR21217.1 GDSL-type esterase/lipase family protein [Desulfomonilia bacterium]HRT44217.1 GDSL-type esterase/lipase family protein [Desulfomonilia bacterium]
MVIDRPHQIIAIGDSLTSGSQPGVSEYAPYTGPDARELLPISYPYVLSELLSVRLGPRLVRNLGRSGSTTRDWLPGNVWERKDVPGFPLNGKPLDMILASREDIRLCLMMIGTNDVSSSVLPDFLIRRINGVIGYEDDDFLMTRENLVIILTRLHEKGITTYLAKIPPNRYQGGIGILGIDRIFFTQRKVQEKLDLYTRMVNSRIDEIYTSYPHLARRGPDFYTLFKGRSDIWNRDLMHLNTLGYRFMAWTWAGLLRSEKIDIQV